MHHGWPRQARPLAYGAPRLAGVLWLFDVNLVIPLWLFLGPPSTHRNLYFTLPFQYFYPFLLALGRFRLVHHSQPETSEEIIFLSGWLRLS